MRQRLQGFVHLAHDVGYRLLEAALEAVEVGRHWSRWGSLDWGKGLVTGMLAGQLGSLDWCGASSLRVLSL